MMQNSSTGQHYMDPYQCLPPAVHIHTGITDNSYFHCNTNYHCYPQSPVPSAHFSSATASAATGYADVIPSANMTVSSYYGSASQYTLSDLSSSSLYNSPFLADSANASRDATVKPRKSTRDEKICGVCGDRALSYNFDAISCESCKAFFRRNAPKGLEHFKCPYDERCRMDVSNRRFCKRCRLNKCFQIGMRKEYILSDEEKAQKRLKIEANRKLRCNAEIRQQSSMSTSNVINTIAHTAVGGEVTSQTVALRSIDAKAIDELLYAYHVSLETQNATSDNIESSRLLVSAEDAGRATNLSDLINIAELSMRRVIAMTKQIAAFRSLSQPDQIQLLKGGSIELLILRSVMTFDADKQQFLDPVDDEETQAMKLEQLRRAEDGTGMFDEQMKFVRSLTVELRADETTLVLLLVISLFSPDRENLVNREYVSEEQERYSLLLKRYLESRYAGPVARLMFPRLIMKLTDIRSLNAKHSHVLLKLNPDGIQPLMKEVLDLRR